MRFFLFILIFLSSPLQAGIVYFANHIDTPSEIKGSLVVRLGGEAFSIRDHEEFGWQVLNGLKTVKVIHYLYDKNEIDSSQIAKNCQFDLLITNNSHHQVIITSNNSHPENPNFRINCEVVP